MSVEKETYVRRRAYNTIHITSWLIYLEKDGHVRCPFKNCNFMAFDVNEMCDHYGFCNGDSSFAKYVCEVCKGCTNSEKRLQEHRSRTHNITILPEQADPTTENNQGEPGKPSKVLTLSWEFFFDKHNYIKCSNCQYVANTMSDMCRHYLVCKQEKKCLRYVCPECKGRAFEVVSLLQHLERAHKISMRPDQFNHISRNMVQFWEKELREEKYATCLHINKDKERDCGYIDVDLLGINEHSQTCKGPKSVASSNQWICEFCQKWTNSGDKLTRHQMLTHYKIYSAEMQIESSYQSKHTNSILQTVKPEVMTTPQKKSTYEQSSSAVKIEAFQSREITRKESNHQPFQKVYLVNNVSPLKENSSECHQMSPTKYLGKSCNGQRNKSNSPKSCIPKENNDVAKNVDNCKSIVEEGSSFTTVSTPVQGSQEIFLDLVEDKLVARKVKGEMEGNIDLKNNRSRGKIFLRQQPTIKIVNENKPIEIVDLRDAELMDQPVSEAEGEINLKSKIIKGEFESEKCEVGQSIEVENSKTTGHYKVSQELFQEETELVEENLLLGKDLDEESQKKKGNYCHLINGDNNGTICKATKEPSYVLFKEELSSDEEDSCISSERRSRSEENIKMSFDSIPRHRTFSNTSPRSYSRRKSNDDKIEGFSPTKPVNTLINENSPPALLKLTADFEEVKRTEVTSFKGKKSYENHFKARAKAKKTLVFQNIKHEMCELQKEESKNSEKNDKLMLMEHCEDKEISLVKQTVSKKSYSVIHTSKTFDNESCPLIMSVDNIVEIENETRQDSHITMTTNHNLKELDSPTNLEILSSGSLLGNKESGKSTSGSNSIDTHTKQTNLERNIKDNDSGESCDKTKYQDGKLYFSNIDLVKPKNNEHVEEDVIDFSDPKAVSFFYNGKLKKPFLSKNTLQRKKSSEFEPSEDKSNTTNQNKVMIAESFKSGNQFIIKSHEFTDEQNNTYDIIKESEPCIPLAGNISVDTQKLDLASRIHSDFEVDGSADEIVENKASDINKESINGIETAESPSKIEVDMADRSLKMVETNPKAKSKLRQDSSDFCKESCDEDFLGEDEEKDLKPYFFSGFQEMSENVQSKSKRFHQFLNRLSESENEEWYVNAGNLSMEVRKDNNCKLNHKNDPSGYLDEEMTVIVVGDNSNGKDLFVRHEEESAVKDLESISMDNKTKSKACFVDLEPKNNEIDSSSEEKNGLINMTKKDLALEYPLNGTSHPSSIESKKVESLKVSLNIDLLNMPQMTKTNINSHQRTVEEKSLTSKKPKMCSGIGGIKGNCNVNESSDKNNEDDPERRKHLSGNRCDTHGLVVCSTPLKVQETLTPSPRVSSNTSLVKDETILSVETAFSDNEPLSDVQKTCQSSVKTILSSKELLTEGFSPHNNVEEKNVDEIKQGHVNTNSKTAETSKANELDEISDQVLSKRLEKACRVEAGKIVKKRGGKSKRNNIEITKEQYVNISNGQSTDKSAQNDVAKGIASDIYSKNDIEICDTPESVQKSSLSSPLQNSNNIEGNSSTPKRRGRPPKRKYDFNTNSSNLKIKHEHTCNDELLVSIYSEEIVNMLDNDPDKTKEDQNFEDDMPCDYSCRVGDFHSSRSKSCQKYDEPHNNTVAYNSSEIQVPKKRGRKPKQNYTSSNSSLGEEIHKDSEIKYNIDMKDSPSEKSCDVSTERIPKKRGRQQKQNNITTHSSLADTIQKDCEMKCNDDVKDSFSEKLCDNSSVRVPKKRGRKPKSQLGPDTSADCNLVPANSTTENLQDHTGSMGFEQSSSNKKDCDLGLVKIPKKRGRPAKPKPQNEMVIKLSSNADADCKASKSELLDTDVILINEEKLNSSQTSIKNFKNYPKKSKTPASSDDDSDRYEPDKIESDDDYSDKMPEKKKRKVDSVENDSVDGGKTVKKKIPKRTNSFFNTNHRSSDKVVCGACKKEMTYFVYKHQHAIQKHYMITWIEGVETPVDMNNQKEVENRLWFAKKRLGKTPFRCSICSLPKLSAVGFYSHIQFCGKDIQEKESLLVTCELCGAKLMPSSMKPHLYMKHNDRQPGESKLNLLDQTLVGKSPRAAAARAVQVIQQHQANKHDQDDPGSCPNSPENKSHLSHLYARPSRVIPAPEYRRWKEMLSTTGVVNCSRPGCKFSTELSIKMRKHFYACPHAPPQLFKCRLCSFTSETEEPMVEHVEDQHDNAMPVVQAESEESTDESDGELKTTDKSTRPVYFGTNIPFKFLKYVHYQKTGSFLFKRKYFTNAIEWTLDLRKKMFTSNTLFLDAQSQVHCQPLTADSLTPHLPELAESIRFRGKSDGDWQKLSRFQSCLLNGRAVLFAGGPVWATAWAPVPYPEEHQYLAVVSHTFVEHTHKMASLYNYPGLIQIWSLGPLPNIGDVEPCPPRLVMGLTQQRGPVWDLSWCPAGAYTQERLGLLAAACGDGSIVVYAVPRVTGDSISHFWSMKPIWELKLGCEMTAQCTCVDWHSADPHSVIAGGFANGIVALWDLTTTSCLLKQGSTILPFKVIEAHHSATTAVQLSCTKENSHLMTASLDRETKFWRVDDTTSPVCLLRKACVTDAVMPSHWLMSISAYDDVYSINSSHVTGSNYRDTFMANTSNIVLQPGTVWGLSFNDWLNACACASEMGRVKAIFRQQLLVSEDSKKTNKNTTIDNMVCCSALSVKDGSPVSKEFGTLYEDCASSIGLEFNFDNKNLKEPKSSCSSDNMDSYPIRSFNTVSWNPNMSSFTWLASGMQCGLVVLTHIKDVPQQELSKLYQREEPR